MKRCCFSIKNKLRQQRDFENVFKNGIFQKSSVFTAYSLENEETFSRLGVSVSRKVGNAVLRNRIKRVVREWFRKKCTDFPKTIDLVIVFRKVMPAFSRKALREDLEKTITF